MSLDLITAFDQLQQLDVRDFLSRDLPDSVVAHLCSLCRSYRIGPEEVRVTLRSHVSFKISFCFFMFSKVMAEDAVRHQSIDELQQGLAALLIENCTFDFRDSIISFSLIFDSARRIGLNVDEFFYGQTNIAGSEMAKLIRNFCAREVSAQAISEFGFSAGENASGQFTYVAKSTPTKTIGAFLKEHGLNKS